jgi:2-oxoglutarate dehydrogenase E2 component (dihydrolipoamide succinyltransferase)
VAVNAPEAGTIKEIFANEEDTVTVGQDLLRLELGGAPGGERQKAETEPKEATSGDEPTSSGPKAPKKDESKPEDKSSLPLSTPSQEKEPEPKKETPPPKQSEPKKTESKPSSSSPVLGNREERRV